MSIELWAARLERPLTERETAAMLRLLPEARRERLLRIKRPEKRREPLCAYLILRHALWEQYRWRELPEIRLSSFGKPYFPEHPDVHFNLSHTAGAVLVGLSFAKSVAYALGVPLIPVHHIRGHIAANYLAFPDLEPPFLALAISGGNTLIVDVRDYTDMVILGATRDDAAGECFDKAARVLGLPYPGGAPLDALAQQSPGGVYALPHAHVDGAELDMSFSGLKTAVVNLAHHAQQVGESLDRAALARDFAQAVSDTLVPRAMEAARQTGRKILCAAGGVAANSIIRGDLQRACDQAGIRLYLPPLKLCGDNGAMIGCQGYYEYCDGKRAGMDLNAYATRDIGKG